jgi:RNA polymerase sigma factor for flagellar operon FliA
MPAGRPHAARPISATVGRLAERLPGERWTDLSERVASCQAMVRSLAWQISRNLPPAIDVEDLVSEGQVGLLQAAQSFDQKKGVQFTTFAYWRIRGAMLDWVRTQSWYDAAEYVGGRLAERAASGSVSEGDTASDASATPAAIQNVADPHTADPGDEVAEDELREVVRGLIGRLGGRARQILETTLLDDKTLEEAGRLMGLHKGSAQRAQVKAFDELAELLQETGVSEMDGETLRHAVYRRRAHGD